MNLPYPNLPPPCSAQHKAKAPCVHLALKGRDEFGVTPKMVHKTSERAGASEQCCFPRVFLSSFRPHTYLARLLALCTLYLAPTPDE